MNTGPYLEATYTNDWAPTSEHDVALGVNLDNPDEIDAPLSVELDPQLALKVEALIDINLQIKELQTRKAVLTDLIQNHMGPAVLATVNGHTRVRWTPVVTKRLDQTAVKKRHPDVYADCTVLTTTRRFTLTGGE